MFAYDLQVIEQAAQALKEGIAECNRAGLAFASALTDIERQTARLRHEAAYQRLDGLKRSFLEQAFRAIACHESAGREMKRGR
jgi:hypothetical protein